MTGAEGRGGRLGGDPLAITWIGHATAVIDLAGTRLVTDPLLQRHAGVLRRRGGRPAESWRAADAVLLSHLHLDHAEVRSLRLFADVPVLTAPANARWARTKGLDGVGLVDEWAPVGGVEVRLAPAVHHARPMPHRPNVANGHLVRGGGLRIWVVGDSEPFPGMVHLPDLAGGPIDVALIPVGGWGPRLSAGHMDPAKAARVCAEVGVGTAIPVHWGTLHAPGWRNLPRGWMDHAGEAFRAAAARVSPLTRVEVLAPGGTWRAP